MDPELDSEMNVPETDSDDEVEPAELLDQEGRRLYHKNKFQAAIKFFTHAISIRDDMAGLYLIRAQCYKELGNWKEIENDCRRAIIMDNGHMLPEVREMLSFSLMKQAEQVELEEGQEESSLQMFLSSAMEAIAAHDLANESEKEKMFEVLSTACNNLRGRVDNMFREVDDIEEFPACFICPLSGELYKDPVVTRYGFSYEREGIFKYIEDTSKDGNEPFDPVTKLGLDREQLVGNFALRDAVTAYEGQQQKIEGLKQTLEGLIGK